VLRDLSLVEALQKVSEESGLGIDLVPGSTTDAAGLLDGQEPRVGYLDLRGAKTHQALDWILRPARLSWRLVNGRIVAASDRRAEGLSTWVYDVRQVALPSADELKPLADPQPRVELFQRAAEQFLAAVRTELALDGPAAVAWFAPGKLLVTAPAEKHAALETLLQQLVDPKHQPRDGLGPLHRETSRRAVEWQATVSKVRTARRDAAVAAVHGEYGWRLLAAAADGQVDVEALTELQIAWKDPATQQLLAGDAEGLLLRSSWILAESARALPLEADLQNLAAFARQQTRPAADKALAALTNTPEDAEAFAKVLYAALTLHDDAAYRQAASRLLLSEAAADSALGRRSHDRPSTPVGARER